MMWCTSIIVFGQTKLYTGVAYDNVGEPCCGPEERRFCEHINEYHPSLELFKYLVQGKASINYGTTVMNIFNATIRYGRTDLVKYTTMCYFHESENVDTSLSWYDISNHCKLNEWFTSKIGHI